MHNLPDQTREKNICILHSKHYFRQYYAENLFRLFDSFTDKVINNSVK